MSKGVRTQGTLPYFLVKKKTICKSFKKFTLFYILKCSVDEKIRSYTSGFFRFKFYVQQLVNSRIHLFLVNTKSSININQRINQLLFSNIFLLYHRFFNGQMPSLNYKFHTYIYKVLAKKISSKKTDLLTCLWKNIKNKIKI